VWSVPRSTHRWGYYYYYYYYYSYSYSYYYYIPYYSIGKAKGEEG
jgi:hypothetical protein